MNLKLMENSIRLVKGMKGECINGIVVTDVTVNHALFGERFPEICIRGTMQKEKGVKR